jgi:peptide/nickel transport system permease protein
MANAPIALPTIHIAQKRPHSRSFWQDALLHLWRDRLTMAALGALLVLTVACLIGPPIVENVLKVDVNRTKVVDRYKAPNPAHILGTDNLGRDQLIRLLYGGRVSLLIAYSASLMSIGVGVSIGIAAGFYGGLIDDCVIWFINTLSSIPALFLLLIASAIWDTTPLTLIVLLVVFVWVDTCRLVRAEVLSLKEREYITAARALGSPNWRLMLFHILPNVLSIVIINLTINAGALILIESGLSFLGLGIQPPTPTWGNMLTDSRSYFAKGTYLVVWPGMLITVTVLCFYLLGDGLRDALDPRSARH